MSELDKILNQYISFEARVGKRITSLCAPYCSACTNICCKPDFCRETNDSPFLSLIREKFSPSVTYDREQGWITPTGCALLVGRPPVCYEFFCNNIIMGQAGDMHVQMISLLGMLISYIGKNALAHHHLVEIMTAEKLHKVKFSRFERRLAEAEIGFAIAESFYENNAISDSDIWFLRRLFFS
ncbi:hypothetical protein [Desulfonema magnum]|uniref:Uncharacterized protein n=1 Tax=Desulfonema magnum TaxID=45655 RepID=A0A975GRH3_9BACT|nr:hypothetical protein [Desulfonema magnum]QTA91004.1 Uncharacterized protein dnm_070680 [Desulfonema magnum]